MKTKTKSPLSDKERQQRKAAIASRWADRASPPLNSAEIIHKAAENGCTRAQIAGALGVGRGKLREWLESPEHGPTLQAAMAEGKEIEHDRLVSFLWEAASTGRMKGSLVAILFML